MLRRTVLTTMIGVLTALAWLLNPAQAADREISVKSDVEFKLSLTTAGTIVHGGTADGAAVSAEKDGAVVKGSDGKILASSKRTGEALVILDSAGAPVYSIQTTPKGYIINLPSGQQVNRIKIKWEEINLYDKDSLRIAHGGKTEDGFSLKDESGVESINVKGAPSIQSAAFLVAPIPVQYRVVLWASMP